MERLKKVKNLIIHVICKISVVCYHFITVTFFSFFIHPKGMREESDDTASLVLPIGGAEVEEEVVEAKSKCKTCISQAYNAK